MKQLLAAVTFAALVASPAFAKDDHHAMSPGDAGAHASMPNGSPEVIVNGRVIGTDPDPAIRQQLYRGANGPA